MSSSNNLSIPKEDMRIILEDYYKYQALVFYSDLSEQLEEAIPYYLSQTENAITSCTYTSINQLIDDTIEYFKKQEKL